MTEQKNKTVNGMRKVMIREKLEEIEYPVEDLVLGDFDQIAEFTAKKARERGSELYNKVGCFFRPNYERGLLIYSLIRRFKINSFLEIGFGRGYSTYCAVKAMMDAGVSDKKIVTVDPNINEDFIKQLGQIFPQEWLQSVDYFKGTSNQAFDVLREQGDKFDLIYIDGDHRFESVWNDWQNSKELFSKFVLFDDYNFGDKEEKDIEVSKVVDEIKDYEKELIIMDRRIFMDDRGYSDDQIDYGQVLVKHPDFDISDYLMDW